MKPHHESAIRMAKVALKRAQHPEIRELAHDIVSTQQSEITLLGKLAKQLTPGGKDYTTLSLDDASMAFTGLVLSWRPSGM